MPSLQDIVFLEQGRPVASIKRRRGDFWRTDTVEGLDGMMVLESTGLQVSMADAYVNVLPDEDDEEDRSADGLVQPESV